MKANRRHELKENDLAHALERGRDYLHENGRNVALIFLAALAVVVIATFTVRSRAVATEDAWRRKAQLLFDKEKPVEAKESLEKLIALTNTAAEESFVLSGLLDQAMQALRLAGEAATPPDPAFNEKAKVAFEQLLSRFPNNPLAVGVAHCGLATVAENRFALDGNPAHKNEAHRHLTAVIENKALERMPFYGLARDRRVALDDTFTRVRFDPAPPSEPMEATGTVTRLPALSAPGVQPVELVPVEPPEWAKTEPAPTDEQETPKVPPPPPDGESAPVPADTEPVPPPKEPG